MTKIKLPSKAEIKDLWGIFKTPFGIRKHSEVVAKVCKYLISLAEKKKLKINPQIIIASALLHDLVKPLDYESFDGASHTEKNMWQKLKLKYPRTDHVEAAGEIISKTYPEVGKTIKAISIKNVLENMDEMTMDEKILLYADRMVIYNRVISDLSEKYNDNRITEAFFYRKTKISPEKELLKTRKIEKELIKKLKFDSEKLRESVKNFNKNKSK